MGIIALSLTSTLLLSGVIGGLLAVVLRRFDLFPGFGRWLSKPSLQKSCLYGVLLFLYNAVLFVSTVVVAYLSALLTQRLNVPVPMLLFAPLAVALSWFGWLRFGRDWQGSFGGRALAALIGSGFYAMLFAWSYCQLSLVNDHPENSMSGFGFLILLFISAVAAVNCLLVVGWPRAKKKHLYGSPSQALLFLPHHSRSSSSDQT